jgi:uncharacterized membrane protein
MPIKGARDKVRPGGGEPRRGRSDPERLAMLADAVFAIALTLMALDLRVGEPKPPSVPAALLPLAPRLLIFIFAFLAVAQQWDVHRRTMAHVTRMDGILFGWFALALMFVVLIPASADVLGSYPFEPIGLLVFGGNIALLCLASWAMWRHAQRTNGLIEPGLPPETARMIGRLWLYPVLVICLSMPLAFVSVYPVYVIWFLMPVVSYSMRLPPRRGAARG